jgi:Xaa-Pro aminopeptidase
MVSDAAHSVSRTLQPIAKPTTRQPASERRHGWIAFAGSSLFGATGPYRSTTICEAFPKAREFGFPDEMSAFGLQFAHGLGLALHERPVISRVVSLDHPTEIKEGMVFAIETYCPATDGYSAARIEEEVVVTDKGCRVISLFPAEELPIANAC